jgi:hypothetical protein
MARPLAQKSSAAHARLERPPGLISAENDWSPPSQKKLIHHEALGVYDRRAKPILVFVYAKPTLTTASLGHHQH